MALVSEKREAMNSEPGDTYVKVMIRRGGAEIWSHLHLKHIHGNRFHVITGEKQAIGVFDEGSEVTVLPIANQDFTHLVTQ